jgi:hypothetical protein
MLRLWRPAAQAREDSDDHGWVVVGYLVRSGRGRDSGIFRPRRNGDDRLRDRQTREPHLVELLRWVTEGSMFDLLATHCVWIAKGCKTLF